MSHWLANSCFLILGYFFGVRRGRNARDALRKDLLRLKEERSQCAQQLYDTQVLLKKTQEQLAARPSMVPGAQPLKNQIDSALKSLLQPLLARDMEARELRAAVNGLLAPMVERERLGLEMTRLDDNVVGREGLSQLLSTMANRAGFSTVLVTDDNGLPMGQNDGAQQVDMLCASLGLMLNMVDRIATNGGAAPLAVVLRDSDNRISLHRLFKVDGQRYVITAITSGSFLPPDVLDPALARIERVLTTKKLG